MNVHWAINSSGDCGEEFNVRPCSTNGKWLLVTVEDASFDRSEWRAFNKMMEEFFDRQEKKKK
jgi:hypothetical protein